MNTGQRIAYLREKRGLSQVAMAEMLDTSPSAIGMWELGKRGLKDDTLNMLANFFNVSTDYLLGRVDFPDNNENMRLLKEEELVNIPIMGTIRCGGGQIAYEEFQGFSVYPSSEIKKGREYFALRVHGDSMIGDGINEGDIALIEKDAEVIQGKIYAVVFDGELATLKHVIKADGTIVLQPSNSKYPTKIIAGEELQSFYIIGRMVSIRRNYY